MIDSIDLLEISGDWNFLIILNLCERVLIFSIFIGVPGSFFRGGQPFLSAKTQSCSAKKISSHGGPNYPFLFCQADVPFFYVTLLCQSWNWVKFAEWWLQNRQKWMKNRQIWQKPNINGWKQANLAEKLTKYGGKGEYWPCSLSALLSFTILFCQNVNFFSAMPPNSVLPS